MKSKGDEGITVKKADNFSEWYTQIVLKSGFADYTDVSGCIVFREDCYAIWENIQKIVDKKLKNLGIRNVYFPLLIPEGFLKKEAEHVEGFSPEVAWVTHTGKSKLNERLAIRPTSETIMYPSYAKWIRSWKDLPLRLNQWNSVVRWEFKNPVPLLRTREFLWNEGHTVFAERKEAEKEMKDIISLWENFSKDYLALPSLVGQKTDKEKFAGAEYTWSTEFILPNGKAIQGPDSHFDGTKFSKAFGISFLDKDEKKQYPFQNTWAISSRMIGVMLAIHGDDNGLVLPPKIVPNKVVVVPIVFKKDKDKVLKFAKDVKKKLGKYGVIFDDREGYSAGWKFNEWELKGIPIRIEVGPKDVAKRQVVLVRRDTGKKDFVKIGSLAKKVGELLEDIQGNLYEKAEKAMNSKIVNVNTFAEFKKAIKDKKVVRTFWCGSSKCEDMLKDGTNGAKSLNIPFDQPKKKGKCVHCGKEGKHLIFFGKSY